MNSYRSKSLIFALTASLLVSGSALSQQAATFQQLESLELARLEEGAQAQAEIERLDDQRLDVVGQFRVALKQRRSLEKYNAQLRELIQSQEEEKQSLQQQINRVGSLERDIVPLMTDMLDALENFVELDLPFFPIERQQRIKNLRDLMSRANIKNSEKYRRIMEAYQIENDYGRSIETEEGILPNSSPKQKVNFLKVGRIALFYQTLDGKRSFRWDGDSDEWQALESKLNKPIKQGIRMALEQIPVNLLILPIQTPTDF